VRRGCIAPPLIGTQRSCTAGRPRFICEYGHLRRHAPMPRSPRKCYGSSRADLERSADPERDWLDPGQPSPAPAVSESESRRSPVHPQSLSADWIFLLSFLAGLNGVHSLPRGGPRSCRQRLPQMLRGLAVPDFRCPTRSVANPAATMARWLSADCPPCECGL
jgi:hypothetical protein